LLLLDHNFCTKSINGSKDSDSSLISNENFIKTLPSSSWALGQVSWDKMAKNLPHIWCHSQKKQKQKIFFHCRLRLAESFEDLNSSLVQLAEEIRCC